MILQNLVRTRKRRLLAATGTLGLCAAVAFAAWLISGDGPGAGKAGTLQALTVTAGAPSNGGCFPGEPCPGYLTVDNPNGPLVITSIEFGNSAQDTTSSPATCPNSSFGMAQQFGLSIPLPAGNGNLVTVPGLFTVGTDAPTACQGVTFTKGVRVRAATP